MIFSSNRNGDLALFKQGVDEGTAQILVSGLELDGTKSAHISPDRKWLLYFRQAAGRIQLMRVPVVPSNSSRRRDDIRRSDDRVRFDERYGGTRSV